MSNTVQTDHREVSRRLTNVHLLLVTGPGYLLARGTAGMGWVGEAVFIPSQPVLLSFPSSHGGLAGLLSQMGLYKVAKTGQ